MRILHSSPAFLAPASRHNILCQPKKVKTVLQILIANIFKPIVHRVGSVVGVYLASADLFTTAQIDILSQGSIILAGFALDLIVRKTI